MGTAGSSHSLHISSHMDCLKCILKAREETNTDTQMGFLVWFGFIIFALLVVYFDFPFFKFCFVSTLGIWLGKNKNLSG